jgi:ferredoxin
MISGMVGGAVEYGGQRVHFREGENVLAALDRTGAAVTSACRAGVYGKCLLRAAEPPPGSQRG